jgi:hypothetical protein
MIFALRSHINAMAALFRLEGLYFIIVLSLSKSQISLSEFGLICFVFFFIICAKGKSAAQKQRRSAAV